MAKTRQVMKISDNGKTFSVVFHEDAASNPYWVYRHTWELRTCGYGYSDRKRIVVKFADIRSCLYYIANEM